MHNPFFTGPDLPWPEDDTNSAEVIACLSDPRWMHPSDAAGRGLRDLVRRMPAPLESAVAAAYLPFLRHPHETGREAATEVLLRGGTLDHLQDLRELAAAEPELLPTASWLRAAGWAISEAVCAGPDRAGRLPPLCGIIIDLLSGGVEERSRVNALRSLAQHDPDAALKLVADQERVGTPTPHVLECLFFFDDFSRLFHDPAASEPVLRDLFRNLASREQPGSIGFDVLMERYLPLAAGMGMPEAEALTREAIADPRHPQFHRALAAARVLSGLGTRWIARWSGIQGEPSPTAGVPDAPLLPHAIWMESLVKLTTSRISFDGFWSIYDELREGEAEAIVRAFAGIGDPLMSRRTAAAAAMVREHGVEYELSPGVFGLPDWCQKEMNAWEREINDRKDLGADVRLDLYLLRHAEHLGGRRLGWIPDELPGECDG